MSTNYQRKITAGGLKNYEVNIEVYESANEMARDCKTRPMTSSSFEDKSRGRFDSWEGVKTYGEALELLANGYQPTVEAMRDKVKGKVMGEQKRMQFQNNVAGFAPIVPLALKGVPNSMIDMRIKPMKCKVIDIYYDMTCSCGTKSEQIIANGQKLLGVILDLEKQGYRFNIYGMQTYTDSESADIVAVRIKSAKQPLDLKRISFPLTHTAFFRVIGFDWYSKTPKGHYRRGYGCGLGYTIRDDKNLQDFAHELLGKNAVFFFGERIMHKGEEYLKEVILNAGK